MRRFHINETDDQAKEFLCTSPRCSYKSNKKSDTRKHAEKCMYVFLDRELDQQAVELKQKYEEELAKRDLLKQESDQQYVQELTKRDTQIQCLTYRIQFLEELMLKYKS